LNKRFKIVTLGCKVNQCESAAIGHTLTSARYRETGSQADPDVIIINTCSVTGRAAMQSRQAIRQAIRQYPEARIVVTGCYAQTEPETVSAIQGIHHIVGHRDKLQIVRTLDETDASPHPLGPIKRSSSEDCVFSALPSITNEARTRAFLKIQDGCDTRCSYCIVPYARGGSRSMPVSDVLDHMAQLAVAGFREVVLTGIHLGAYGLDLTPPTSLAQLLSLLTRTGTTDRIRLSSIEPKEINPRIIQLAAQSKGKICRHFHIPLQSGDDDILRRMGRPYTREQFAQIVQSVHGDIPGVAIGADVMAGFPGETQEAFENTYRLLESLPVAYLHVFPFSPRKGTPAADYTPKVPQRISKARCRQLRQLGERKKEAFYRKMIGQSLQVLVQKGSPDQKGRAEGLSDNYIPVVLNNVKVQSNQMADVRIVGLDENNRVLGEVEQAASRP